MFICNNWPKRTILHQDYSPEEIFHNVKLSIISNGGSFFFRDKNLYKLRNKCSFLLDNLQYYLQVDVIETNYTIMINAIKNSTNYQIVLDAHKQFINSIVKESFVCAEPVTITHFIHYTYYNALKTVFFSASFCWR